MKKTFLAVSLAAALASLTFAQTTPPANDQGSDSSSTAKKGKKGKKGHKKSGDTGTATPAPTK
jgi:hypothetical protein